MDCVCMCVLVCIGILLYNNNNNNEKVKFPNGMIASNFNTNGCLGIPFVRMPPVGRSVAHSVRKKMASGVPVESRGLSR